jgi:hypothetical protein
MNIWLELLEKILEVKIEIEKNDVKEEITQDDVRKYFQKKNLEEWKRTNSRERGVLKIQ